MATQEVLTAARAFLESLHVEGLADAFLEDEEDCKLWEVSQALRAVTQTLTEVTVAHNGLVLQIQLAQKVGVKGDTESQLKVLAQHEARLKELSKLRRGLFAIRAEVMAPVPPGEGGVKPTEEAPCG